MSGDTVAQEKHEIMHELSELLQGCSLRRLMTIKTFSESVIDQQNENLVASFLDRKDDQVLDTILLLMSSMDCEQQARILEQAKAAIDASRD